MAIKKRVLLTSTVGTSHPITVQAKLYPNGVYKQSVPGDGIAPPGALAFTVVPKHTKRKRGDDAHAIVTNMHDITSRLASGSRLQYIGVVQSGTIDEKGVYTHPNAIGHMSVIVSGLVEILCSPNDLTDINVGDLVTWELADSGVAFQGYPETWTTAKLVKYTPPLGALAVNPPCTTLFGPIQTYQAKHRTEFMTRLDVLQSMEKGNFLELMGVQDMTPMRLVAEIAHVLLAHLDIKIPVTKTWVDVLYDPTSPYYIMERRPDSPMSFEWIQHFSGNINSAEYISYSVADGCKRAKETTPNRYAIPQSMGWGNEFVKCADKKDLYADYKTANANFDRPVWNENVLFYKITNQSIETATKDAVQQYINVIGPATHSRALMLQYIIEGFIHPRKNLKIATTQEQMTIIKALPYLAKTQYTFKDITHRDATDLIDTISKHTGVYIPDIWHHTHRHKLLRRSMPTTHSPIGTFLSRTESHITLLLKSH